MERNWKRICHWACLLLLSFAWTVGAADQPAKTETEPKKPDPGQKVIAVVNGTQVLERDLQMTIQEMRRQFGEKSITQDSPEVLRRKALDQFLAVELLFQEGRTLGLQDVDTQVEALWSGAEKQAGSPEKFEEQLAKDGLTRDQAKDNIKKNIYVRAVVTQKVVPTIKVEDAELQAFYQAHQEQYRHGEMVGARHILIKVALQAKEEEKQQAREKIDSIRKDLLAGRDFQETAKAVSDCPSKTRGGDLGYFGKGRMVPEFEKAAFGLKEGEISPVVETQFGFHIIQVYGKKPSGVTPFEEVKKQVEGRVKNEKFNRAVSDYVGELRKKARVEILDPGLQEGGK
ncbi:MAG: peptidylprolyl isomerase [Deltaproteobacteria bacterium]|nr:peptidylprolyl isomerase [Deltaproteobacteria bacterium]